MLVVCIVLIYLMSVFLLMVGGLELREYIIFKDGDSLINCSLFWLVSVLLACSPMMLV